MKGSYSISVRNKKLIWRPKGRENGQTKGGFQLFVVWAGRYQSGGGARGEIVTQPSSLIITR